MVQIARRFFKKQNLLIAVSGIVILANAGGAWSPIGDVTTIMLWLAEKFSAAEVIKNTFIPSVVLGMIALFMLQAKMSDSTFDVQEEMNLRFTNSEKLIIGLTLLSFTFPLIMNSIGLPPYMGLLLGLGLIWAIIEFIKSRSKKETHLSAQIEQLLQKTDIASIQFFIGILLSVSALNTLGVLEEMSHIIYGAEPPLMRLILGNSLLGLLSAIVDNVPLTALAIDILHVQDSSIWSLMALTVGTGGSALVVGSVAGVIAMGMVKELTFQRYLKIATIPAVTGYCAAIAVWYMQFSIM